MKLTVKQCSTISGIETDNIDNFDESNIAEVKSVIID